MNRTNWNSAKVATKRVIYNRKSNRARLDLFKEYSRLHAAPSVTSQYNSSITDTTNHELALTLYGKKKMCHSHTYQLTFHAAT